MKKTNAGNPIRAGQRAGSKGAGTRVPARMANAAPVGIGPKDKAPRLRRGEASDRIPEILNAAAAEFAQSGFVGARMEDIAARVGVTKPIIYRHFKSKRALLEALLGRELATDYSEVAQQIRAHDGEVKPMLRAVIEQVKDGAPRSPDRISAFRLILADGNRVPKLGRKFHRQTLGPVRRAVEHIFTRAMAQGRMRKADPEFAAREVFAPFFHSMTVLAVAGREEWGPWRTADYLDHALASFCRSYEIDE